MFFPCVMAFNAFCNRTPSRFAYSLNALESGFRGFPWIGVCGSIGGRRTNFDKDAILVESRIFWIGLVVEAIVACVMVSEHRKTKSGQFKPGLS
jgi:hypothetical protein